MSETTNQTLDSRPLAIRVDHVSKLYRLGQIGGATLQRDIQSWWARVRGKEDPNSPIGAESVDRMRGEKFCALDDVSLTVHEGEALGIIGHNGAGKSTLLKLLSRVTAPTKGSIDIYGSLSSMLEVGTGFHPEMTGRENIYLNGAFLGMPRSEVTAKLDDIVEFSEIGKFVDTPVKRYSSGMYVKLAFAVAAHLDSDIMIMDEVLAVGDMAFQRKCISKMRELATTEGRTVLCVSHNMNSIRQLCDRCVVLDSGKLVFDGDTAKAIEIYMNNRKGDEVRLDFSGDHRPRWLDRPHLDLTSAEYLGKSSNKFEEGEPIRFRLVWVNQCDLPGVSLRVEIRTADDTPVGTYVLFDFYHGEEGKKVTLDLELGTKHLTEGSYYMVYTFFQHDDVGNNINVEWRRGLPFEFTRERTSQLVQWDAGHWGFVQLTDINIASLSEGR